MLSSLSQFAGVVLSPRRESVFQQIEFLRLSEKRILLVIVDPRHLPGLGAPPAARLEQVLVNGLQRPWQGTLTLPPGPATVAIHVRSILDKTQSANRAEAAAFAARHGLLAPE